MSQRKIINLSKGEKEKDILKSPVHRIAHEIYDFADETVAHAEGVSKDELMLETYHKLGTLLANWGKKLDQIEKVSAQPEWLSAHIDNEEKVHGRSWVDLGRETFGFEIEGLFFAKEKKGPKLSDDLLMVSEPHSMWMEDFKELIDFCIKNNLDFYVDGFSTRLPGRTMRLVIYKPRKSTFAHTHQDFRENSMVAIGIFEDLSRGNNLVVEKKKFEDALMATGKFDPDSAVSMVKTLLVSGRIQKSKLV